MQTKDSGKCKSPEQDAGKHPGQAQDQYWQVPTQCVVKQCMKADHWQVTSTSYGDPIQFWYLFES